MTDDHAVSPKFSTGDQIRTEIGDFEVQQVLGTSGMDVVYQVVRAAQEDDEGPAA